MSHCPFADVVVPAEPKPGDHVAGRLTEATQRLIEQLQREGITDPLGEPFTLACVLADLFALTDVPLPDEIGRRLAHREITGWRAEDAA